MHHTEQKIQEFEDFLKRYNYKSLLKLRHSNRKPKRFYLIAYLRIINKHYFRIKSLRKKL